MLFRRIILSALFVGVLTGLLLSAIQLFMVNPIIFAAEAFEAPAEVPELKAEAQLQLSLAHTEHSHSEHLPSEMSQSSEANTDPHGHSHSHESWAPEDGAERTLFTVLSNILAGIGFSAVILSLMSQMQSHGIGSLTMLKGSLWGAAGFLAFFVAPGIGLPPEIPGVEAAAIEYRQLWWLLAVFGVGLGIFILVFASLKYKILGLISILIPYLMSIPHQDGPAFAHPNPAVVNQLMALHQQFILASGFTNLIFWILLGTLSAWSLNRYIYKGLNVNA